MPDQVQLRGGTAADNDAFTGANREVTVDTTNKTLRVHDGVAAGGSKLAAFDEWGRLQVADPQDAQDVTNKSYVDGAIEGSQVVVLGRATDTTQRSTTETATYQPVTGASITVTPTRVGAVLEIETSFYAMANRTSSTTVNRIGFFRLFNTADSIAVEGAEAHEFGRFATASSSNSTPSRAPLVIQGRHVVANLDPITFRLEFKAWDLATIYTMNHLSTLLLSVKEWSE